MRACAPTWPAARFPAGTRLYLGGAPAQGADFLDAVYGAFPWIVALTLLLAMVALARAFGSVVAAALAVALDLVSVAAAYGLIVADLSPPAWATASWAPTRWARSRAGSRSCIFAVLFGLSSDYEVFIVSRMREAREAGAESRAAIVEGLAAPERS